MNIRRFRLSGGYYRLFLFSLAVGLFYVSYWAGNRHAVTTRQPPQLLGVVVESGAPIPTFPARAADGSELDLQQFAGRWVIWVFADPVQRLDDRLLARLLSVHNRLAAVPSVQQELRFLLIAPEPPQASWSAAQHSAFSPDRPGFTLALVTAETWQNIRRDTALMPLLPAEDQAPSHLLVDPRQRVRLVFPDGQDAAAMAADILELAVFENGAS